jgi:hypothetical protein
MSIIIQRDAIIHGLLYFCKLLYMFRVVAPPIIRSTYTCNYSIWHCRSNFSTIAGGTRDDLTSARCCNYSYMCSWWWVELPTETCRAVYRNIINRVWSHVVGQLLTLYLVFTYIIITTIFSFYLMITFLICVNSLTCADTLCRAEYIRCRKRDKSTYQHMAEFSRSLVRTFWGQKQEAELCTLNLETSTCLSYLFFINLLAPEFYI